jgi:hypothetical protein
LLAIRIDEVVVNGSSQHPPQRYKYDSDSKRLPLAGEEIGKFVAQAVEGKINSRRPWYEPLDKLPEERIITVGDVGTLVVERPEISFPT